MSPTRLLTSDPHYPDWVTLTETARTVLAGGVVVFRTDTIYGLGASVFDERAVARVRWAKGSGPGAPLLLIVPDRSWAEACTRPDPLAREIMNDLWPAPLTLILPASPLVPRWITAGGDTVAVRLPTPGFGRYLARVAGLPLTATSANRHGEGAVASGAAAARYFRNEVDLVVESGEVKGVSPSTIVDLSGGAPRIVRRGPVTEERLEAWLAGSVTTGPDDPYRVLLVCSGNTCRSPMAQKILEALLAEKGAGGFRVESAGIAAIDGEPVSPGAEETARANGLSLAGFRARRLSRRMAREADLILTMDPRQRMAILTLAPEIAGKVSTISAFAAGLSPDEGDAIPDPIGGDAEQYGDVYHVLEQALTESLVPLLARAMEERG